MNTFLYTTVNDLKGNQENKSMYDYIKKNKILRNELDQRGKMYTEIKETN